MFSYYIWIRFLQERLPRDIPFLHFSFFSLCIIVYICAIYISNIYNLVNTHYENSLLIKKLIDLCYIPLEKFDEFLKSFKPINTIYRKYLVKFVYLLPKYVINSQVFYYLLGIIPRVILVSTLCIDTYYFHYLDHIYKILLFGGLLFLRRYFKYCLKKTKKEFLEKLQLLAYIRMHPEDGRKVIMNREDFDWNDDKYADYFTRQYMISVTIKEYIDYQTKYIFLYKGKRCERYFYTKRWKDLNTNEFYYIVENEDESETRYPWPAGITEEILEKRLENILQIAVILHYFENSHNNDYKINDLKILIYINYLLCWIYILITSIENLDYFPKQLIKMKEYLNILFQL